MGELNTIASGFSREGVSSVGRKWYARFVMHLETEVTPMPTLSFTKEDLGDVFPHDNDHVVISIIIKSRIHRVLVDQGSLVDVLFWDAFCGHGRIVRRARIV